MACRAEAGWPGFPALTGVSDSEGDSRLLAGLVSSAEVAPRLAAVGCVPDLLPLLISSSESKAYVNPLVCAFFIALLPIWIIIAKKNAATREVLYFGWEPVIIAMAISR